MTLILNFISALIIVSVVIATIYLSLDFYFGKAAFLNKQFFRVEDVKIKHVTFYLIAMALFLFWWKTGMIHFKNPF